MKTVLSILGIIFLVIIVVVAGIIGYAAFNGSKLDASSKAYVDEAVPAIVSTWKREELLKRASPQLREAVSDEKVGELFIKFGQLGAFQSYDGCKGESKINVDQNGETITAVYNAEATFANGKATIELKLIQNKGVWQILGFHVNSPFFSN